MRINILVQLGEIFPSHNRFELGSFIGFESDFLAKRIRDNQNITEQNGRIESEAPNRLQSGFRREGGGVAKIQKGRGFGPDLLDIPGR